MNFLMSLNFWYVWPIGVLFLALVAWFEFGVLETIALRYPSNKRITLSFFVYTCTSKFPLATIMFVGFHCMLIGGLMVHFWWHWCPPGSTSAG